MIDIYVTEFHPVYQVWVEGRVWQTMIMNTGHPRLTDSEMTDIAIGFAQAIDGDWPLDIAY